jgi:3-methyl-2-oxobutanoate hydroxymethyltransferase
MPTLIEDAIAAEQAGAFAVLVECVPSDLGQAITEAINVPTIGIGAGPHLTGQVLVTHDMIGFNSGYLPSFVRQYSDVRTTIRDAAVAYRKSIQTGDFPASGESFQ